MCVCVCVCVRVGVAFVVKVQGICVYFVLLCNWNES